MKLDQVAFDAFSGNERDAAGWQASAEAVVNVTLDVVARELKLHGQEQLAPRVVRGVRMELGVKV